MTTRTKARYGWVRDLPDVRDEKLTAVNSFQAVPSEFALSADFMPAVRDQGNLGSCTAFALGGAMEFLLAREIAKATPNVDRIIPSHLFVYYQERVLERTVNEDAGAMLRDGMKVLALWGAPDESVWPYDISKFTQKPPQPAYDAAHKARLSTYKSVPASAVKQAVYGYGPVCFGISVYESFESDEVARTGIVPVPSRSEQMLGGHAIWAWGWKVINGSTYIRCRNHWGSQWGDAGNFYLPEVYVTNADLADDFWSMAVTT